MGHSHTWHLVAFSVTGLRQQCRIEGCIEGQMKLRLQLCVLQPSAVACIEPRHASSHAMHWFVHAIGYGALGKALLESRSLEA